MLRTMGHLSKAGALAALTAIAFFSNGCASSQNGAASNGSSNGEVRLYAGFGNYHRTITTESRDAQKWFDQGMQLLYGFNHDEAIRSFKKAGELDPNCAMAWWGVSYAHGLHINNPQMTEAQSRSGYEAAQEALKRIDHASPVEQALIRAVAVRYQWPAPEDRKPLDEAYAKEMAKAWKTFPSDPDVGALYAESLMNLQPWDLWTRDYKPKGNTEEIVRVLQRVLDLDTRHPGANHFYIHTMEASAEPEKALASADRLAKLVPGSGHLVHMPAHIYARLGRWNDASDSNDQAIKVDRAYFKVAPPPGFYSLYFVHNIHFLAWSAMMEGRYAKAMESARALERDIPQDFLREWPQFADGFMPVTYHVMIRFGKWDDILAEPEPESFRHVSRTFRHYARGVALSALGRTAEARAELDAFERSAAQIPEHWQVGQNKAHEVVKVARQMLRGELLYREGAHDQAFEQLRQGVKYEEALVYDEPPGWMQPVRHALGALMMASGRYEDAEQVYREDLVAYPNNGWSLLGLQQALRAQLEMDQAQDVTARLRSTWKRADVKPNSSCYCEPALTRAN